MKREKIVSNKILKVLQNPEHASLTPAEIARALNKAHTIETVQYNLISLESLGLVKHYGVGRGNRYYLLREHYNRSAEILKMLDYINRYVYGLSKEGYLIDGLGDGLDDNERLEIEHILATGLSNACGRIIEYLVEKGIDPEAYKPKAVGICPGEPTPYFEEEDPE